MMNEEIKEILDNLIINETTGMCYLSIRLTNQTRNVITNLQQENKRLNNKIKEQNLLLIEFQDMEQKVNIYKSRCEKAIHLIKHNDIYDYRVFEEKLKNILNGD